MKKFLTTAALALLLPLVAGAQETFTPSYKYRITLRDKKHNDYSLKHPEQFLSQKSLERRRRQKLKLDETDLPVSPAYVKQILSTGVTLCSKSKWNNTVLVQTTDTTLLDAVAQMPFVAAVRKVATYAEPAERDDTDRFALVNDTAKVAAAKVSRTEQIRSVFSSLHPTAENSEVDSIGIAVAYLADFMRLDDHDEDEEEDEAPSHPIYGKAFTQINQLHGQSLHERGFRGQGMTIAIIDGGFYNADIIPMLKNVNILGVKDFVDPNGNVYEEDTHGMMVLSCIGTNTPGTFVGTAPEAAFWLLRSEDGYSEQMVEEDNWCAAVEFADSVGVDVVNTSLGYSRYDNPADNVRYWEMDGHTRICSHTGSLMASKGMVLCTSAGNEASKTWKLISIPADADNVLTVGAVTDEGINSNFSSIGNSADGRIKPDVMAMGVDATVLSPAGKVTTANGTSFASPIMCGMVTCFWQAHPEMTALDVVKAVRKLGDNVEHPNNVFGYGIPNFSK
ncbi:MAG: S8 family serine peptidase [Prevotellaceae bacterium]|nr:S8 family serine peptidase [Prevotellaceae bacterium]